MANVLLRLDPLVARLEAFLDRLGDHNIAEDSNDTGMDEGNSKPDGDASNMCENAVTDDTDEDTT